MVTLRDLLGELPGVRPLSGADALDVPVRWVHISELKDPTAWLSGGELLLTTGMQLNTAARQREFVTRLADHGLAGVGFGTGFGHREVPEPLLEAARERGFPVLEIPYETPFIAVTEAAFTQLVNEQYAVLRRALAAHERLERVVLSEQGLGAIAAVLATLIGAAVLICDGRGAPLATHVARQPLGEEAIATVREEILTRRGAGHPARPFLPAHPELAERALALPVSADAGPRAMGGTASAPAPAEAWLVAVKDSGPLSDFDRLTLHQAVTIVALELLRGRVAVDTERRLAGDVLSGIVSGELTGRELAARLTPFGLTESVAAVVVGLGPVPAETEAALAAAVAIESGRGLAAGAGVYACALLPGGSEEELTELAEAIAARLPAGAERGRPVLGLGRAVEAGHARRSFHEARCALEARTFAALPDREGGEPSRASPGVATYRDLGSFQLLLSLQDEEALRLFCDSILGPIEAGDGHYGGELMRSLEAFIEENGQWERAARRLYCHRHTLRYRIRRVEELTGRSLASARDRIDFWLALRGRELVS